MVDGMSPDTFFAVVLFVVIHAALALLISRSLSEATQFRMDDRKALGIFLALAATRDRCAGSAETTLPKSVSSRSIGRGFQHGPMRLDLRFSCCG
jgi:hypothetical protein